MTIVRNEHMRTISSKIYLTEEEETALYIAARVMESIESEMKRVGKADSTISTAVYALEAVEEEVECNGLYLVE